MSWCFLYTSVILYAVSLANQIGAVHLEAYFSFFSKRDETTTT
jgi:hypothetical protein